MTKIIIKKSYRRTISLSVEDDGIVLVKAPRYVSNSQIEGFIIEKRKWLDKRLMEMKDKKEKEQRFRDLINPVKTPYYREKARDILIERANYYAEKFSLPYKQVRLSSAKTRWGSCSYQNNLNFNWRIMFAPPQVLDYLVVHEIAHTVHKNHQKKFWQLVEKMHPEFKESRKWLKSNSHLLSA